MHVVRQEKLLQGLMTEIIRMTSQMQPLEVGFPLYPFSHSGLFARSGNSCTQGTGAPLPNGRTFDEQQTAAEQQQHVVAAVAAVAVPSGVTSLSTPPMAHAGPGQASTSSNHGVAGWNARLSPMGRVVMPSQAVPAQSSYPH